MNLSCKEKIKYYSDSGSSTLSSSYSDCDIVSPRPYGIIPQKSTDIYQKCDRKEELRFSFPDINTDSYRKALNDYIKFDPFKRRK